MITRPSERPKWNDTKARSAAAMLMVASAISFGGIYGCDSDSDANRDRTTQPGGAGEPVPAPTNDLKSAPRQGRPGDPRVDAPAVNADLGPAITISGGESSSGRGVSAWSGGSGGGSTAAAKSGGGGASATWGKGEGERGAASGSKKDKAAKSAGEGRGESAGAMYAAPMPPRTRVDAVTDEYFGEQIVDKYRWLEGNNADPANMGAVTPEVAAWTDAQNAHTRSVLDNLPGRERVEARLRELMEIGSISAPVMAGDRYFYSKREGNENQARVFMRTGHKGKPVLLLDPNKIDESGLVTVSWFRPSLDGKMLAYGTYRAGDELSVLNVIRVNEDGPGEKLSDTIANKVGGVDWLPDSSGFVYRNLSDVKNPYSGQVRFHSLGAKVEENPLIIRQFTPDENKELATTYGPWGGLSRSGKWGVIGYSTDTRNNDLWVFDFENFRELAKAGTLKEVERQEIIVGDKSQSSGDIVGDWMILNTTNGAANGRVVKVDLNNPARSNWTVLVPERKDAVIESVNVAGVKKDGETVKNGIVAVNYMVNAANEIELFDFDGKKLGQLKLPGIGSAGLSTDEDRTEAFLTFTSFNYPTTVFRVNLAKPSAEPELWERFDVPVDPKSVEVKQEWYSSKDGTRIPMFIVHKKGLKLDGDNPTILNGYGGFNVPMTPFFSATLFQWFDEGGVFALPNLRGGGEFGKDWHEGGKLANKQNVFDDFIAAAEHLIQAGYTKPSRLAISGGSNGGLLTGAALTQRPDLFGAVIVAVPLLDMLRFENFLMAKYWVPEYGSAQEQDQFAYLRKYSPYHNVKPGTKYPAVFLTAGENDTRVHALHARKMAALLQSATGSDQSQKPVLLWVDRDAGHGQGKPLNLRVRDAADGRMFVMWQLGMLEGK